MTKKHHHRTQGEGTVYLKRSIYWIAYKGPDGKRKQESSGSKRPKVALNLLRKRLGAVLHNLPVVPRAEFVTFSEAADAVIDDFKANQKRSIKVVQRRITKHLLPYFGGRRLASITSRDVAAYVAKRQDDSIVTRKARTLNDGTTIAEQTKTVSPAEINRELQVLKRIFNLAIEQGRIATKPIFKMLREDNVRAGFFEADQYRSVLAHLPEELRPVITFAYFTGWRIASEVLPLQWRQVDFEAGEVRLDAGTTKNREGRVFPFGLHPDLKAMLDSQWAEHERLKKAGQIVPTVFFRMVAEGRGGEKKPQPIVSLAKAWQAACKAAGCPGRIPHDLRRTAVRNLVRAGVSEHSAMKLVGHKTRSVFDRYDIVSGDDLKDAVRRLGTVRHA